MASVPIKGRDYKVYERGSAASGASPLKNPYSKAIELPLGPDQEQKYVGTESLFNRFYAFYFAGDVQSSGTTNINYFDDNRGWNPLEVERNPTASRLISWSREGKNACEYSWEDFLWCKNYGKIPNNYMITLRRFGSPAGDNLLNAERMGTPDIGRMISWIDGEQNKIEDLMKFSVKLNWEEFKSEIQTYQASGSGGSGSGSLIGKILGATDTKGSKAAAKGSNAGNHDPYSNQTNKTLGPINVIDKMMVRKRGLVFDQTIKIIFEYEMRSLDGINGKIAFLDLIMNILMVTYNRGDFWGGAKRFVGGHRTSNPLAGQDGMAMLAKGDFGGFLGKLTDGLSNRLNDLTGGKGLSLEGIGNALKTVGGNVAMRAGGAAADKMGRPQAQATMALLTGEDTGEWHVAVGNPARPMLSMGNMILESTELEFAGPLSKDDFPTKLKVTCNLKPARPRDRDDVQMMFAPGNEQRLYSSALDFIKNTYYGQVAAGDGAAFNPQANQAPDLTLSASNQFRLDGEEANVTNILAQRFPNHQAGGAGSIENTSKYTT